MSAGPLSALLGKPISGLLSGIGGIVDKLSTTQEEKMQAQAELMRIELEFHKATLSADASFATSQAQVITAEANSASWIARNWRPLTMLTFVFIIAWNFIIAPLAGVKVLPTPDRLWDIIELGLGGYVIGRSAEKTLPAMVKAYAKATK